MSNLILFLKENKGLTCFIFLACTFLLCLSLCLYLLLYNGHKLYLSTNYITIDVIWQDNLTPAKVKEHTQQLIKKYHLIFLKNIRPQTLKKDLLSGITDPALFSSLSIPYVTVFKYKYIPQKTDVSNLLNKLKSFPQIKNIVYSQTKASLLHSWMRIEKGVLYPLILGIIGMIGLLIFLALRLLLLAKTKEIEIFYLVGASDFYVFKPIFCFALFILLASGVVAYGINLILSNYFKQIFHWFGLKFFVLPYTYVLFFFLGLSSLALVVALTSFWSLRNAS